MSPQERFLCLSVMCSRVKQQATGSTATSLFLNLTLANIYLPEGAEQSNPGTLPWSLSIDEYSLHQLVENSSEAEPMTCSFKVLFIFLSSILFPHTLSEQVCKQPCGSERPDFKAVLSVLRVKKLNSLTFLLIRAEIAPYM